MPPSPWSSRRLAIALAAASSAMVVAMMLVTVSGFALAAFWLRAGQDPAPPAPRAA